MAIKRPAYLDPLSESEFEQFEAALRDTELGCAMDVEQIDGFFSGLIAGPPVPRPCHYWPVIFGKEPGDGATLHYLRLNATLLPLLARHWHAVSSTLQQDRIYLPHLTLDDSDATSGRQWARGFLHAVRLHPEAWHSLVCNDDLGAALLPMMIIAHQEDPSLQLRSPHLSEKSRHELLLEMTAGLFQVNRYFAPLRRVQSPAGMILDVN